MRPRNNARHFALAAIVAVMVPAVSMAQSAALRNQPGEQDSGKKSSRDSESAGVQQEDEDFAYILSGVSPRSEVPTELDNLPTKILRRIPELAPDPRRLDFSEAAGQQLAVPKDLQMSDADRRRLTKLGLPDLRRRHAKRPAAPACGNHAAIGTVVPGTPLEFNEPAGTWASMAISEGGIDGLSGFVFTPMSNVAAQTLEILGAYGSDGLAELSVFDWSCVDGKSGLPPCSEETAWVYVKRLKDIPGRYKFRYWDGCRWQKALALANKSRPLIIQFDAPAPFKEEVIDSVLYVNEAKILNWKTLKWETFYARLFSDRDTKPPRPWGPAAFVEFISDAGCPDIPRLGFREVRFQGRDGAWQLADSTNASLRFDLPDHYRYGLLDPNHTWSIVPKE